MKENSGQWQVIDLPLSPYREVLKVQEEIARNVVTGEAGNTLLLVEHFPVFTMGNTTNPANLKVNQHFLADHSIECVQTRRGGDITYHGPGQLIAYPIIAFKSLGISVPDYVSCLEEVMLQTASRLGVSAQRSKTNRGIWCGDKKLGSVGIAMKRWVTYHGLALNIDMDLTPFTWINPCGLKQISVTSLSLEKGRATSLHSSRAILREVFCQVFSIKLDCVAKTIFSPQRHRELTEITT